MSKYTTEVRFICEHDAGLSESKGANDVDSILTNSWNKIFTTNCTFFDDAYRSILCKKILKHYYLREIGTEVVGIWKLWMNTKLEEIMPYYNKLYSSALLEFDPFKDVNYEKRHDGTNSGNTESQASINGNNESSGSSNTDGNTDYTEDVSVTNNRDVTTNNSHHSSDRYSDTPQGTINNTDVTGDSYLTNVRLIDSTDSGTSNDSFSETKGTTGNNSHSETGSHSENSTYSELNNTSTSTNSTDAYLEKISGKMNTTPYSDLLNKYRETFLNIDMLVIEEFEELFFGLW